MDISYLTNHPQFQKLSPEKKQFLLDFANTEQNYNSKEMAQVLIGAITKAQKSNLQFTQDENTLLIAILKQHMTPSEAAKADQMMKLMKQMKRT